MVRIILFLALVAVAALGVAWIADQSGTVSFSWDVWRVDASLPVFALGLAVVVVVAIQAWALIRGMLRTPERLRRRRQERHHARGRHAITHGLIAIGTGDHLAARRHATAAKRFAHQDPLALLLHAQAAQLDGDREGAQLAFRAMAERKETRLLGLRGLFIEAQRSDDPYAAVAIAEEALKLAPASPWASHAVLGFRCANNDWDGALKILETNLAAGLIDSPLYRRQRGVLLTARALDAQNNDRDLARQSAMDAVKLAPTLVPAAVLASKFLSEDGQTRRAMRIIEAAWIEQPHPDLADAYAHVRLGDSALERLARVESLAKKAPGHLESALAVARAALDAAEFAHARESLAPFVDKPTQRVALLMAELERAEHGDDGRARSWTLQAVRAAHDPAWTADGYVSDHWRPVSPVSGRLDAFQWLTPVAALPSDKGAALETQAEQTEASQTSPRKLDAPRQQTVSEPVAAATTPPTPPAAAAVPVTPPVFRPRAAGSPSPPVIPPIVPLVRAPDDPGPAEGAPEDEFAAGSMPPRGQAGGWRGFLSRLVG